MIDKIKDYQILIFLIIVLTSGFLVLTQPARLKIAEDWAKEEVYSSLKQSIIKQVYSNYPSASEDIKNQKIEEEFNKIKKSDSAKQQIKQLSEEYKDYYRDPSGQTYVYSVDPYIFLIEARNLLNYGTVWDKSGGSALRRAPRGESLPPSILPYFTVYFYKFLNLFKTTSLETAAFYLPVILGMISIMFVFFISRKIMNNDLFAFFSAFLFSIHPRFFAGSYAGYNDTQILAMLFSLSTMLCFVYFIDFKNKIISLISLVFLFFSIYLLKLSWPGWFYIIPIIGAYLIIFTFLFFTKKYFKDKEKKYGIFLVLFSIVILFVFINYTIIDSNYIRYVKQRLSPQIMQNWPTALTTVSELKQSSPYQIINILGGYILVFIAFIEILFIITQTLKLNPEKYKILVILWFIPLLIAGYMSRRFAFFITPSFCIIIGLFISRHYDKIISITNNISIKKISNKIIIPVLITLVLFINVSDDLSQTKAVWPIMNDAIYETTQHIKQNSNSTAIINNWWDLGYILPYYAERGTVIDNALFDTSRLYFISKAFATNNENESINYLKVMDCNNDNIIGDLITTHPKKTNEFLKQNYPNLTKFFYEELNVSSDYNILIHYKLDCIPESFIIINENDLLKLNHMFNYANWNFTAENKNELKDISDINKCSKEGSYLSCANDFIIDLENIEAQANEGHPYSLVLFRDGKMFKKYYSDSSVNFSIIVYQEDEDNYKSLFMDHELSESIALRLFGVDEFKNLRLEKIVNKPIRTVVWRIIWPKIDFSQIIDEVEIRRTSMTFNISQDLATTEYYRFKEIINEKLEFKPCNLINSTTQLFECDKALIYQDNRFDKTPKELNNLIIMQNNIAWINKINNSNSQQSLIVFNKMIDNKNQLEYLEADNNMIIPTIIKVFLDNKIYGFTVRRETIN